MKEHPEEREMRRALSAAEYQAHVNALGFKFTKEELDEAMEERLQLSVDELDAVSGGACSGCGVECEDHDYIKEEWEASQSLYGCQA